MEPGGDVFRVGAGADRALGIAADDEGVAFQGDLASPAFVLGAGAKANLVRFFEDIPKAERLTHFAVANEIESAGVTEVKEGDARWVAGTGKLPGTDEIGSGDHLMGIELAECGVWVKREDMAGAYFPSAGRWAIARARPARKVSLG
jgi:hypothetical protein